MTRKERKVQVSDRIAGRGVYFYQFTDGSSLTKHNLLGTSRPVSMSVSHYRQLLAAIRLFERLPIGYRIMATRG